MGRKSRIKKSERALTKKLEKDRREALESGSLKPNNDAFLGPIIIPRRRDEKG